MDWLSHVGDKDHFSESAFSQGFFNFVCAERDF